MSAPADGLLVVREGGWVAAGARDRDVGAQTRERHSGLLRRLVRAGAVGLARRDALEHVFLAALLAAHTDVAVDAAQRQAKPVHRLEPPLGPRHGEPVGEDSAL